LKQGIACHSFFDIPDQKWVWLQMRCSCLSRLQKGRTACRKERAMVSSEE